MLDRALHLYFEYVLSALSVDEFDDFQYPVYPLLHLTLAPIMSNCMCKRKTVPSGNQSVV